MTRVRLFVLLCSALVALVGLVFGGLRVIDLERTELEERSPTHTLRAWTEEKGSTRVSVRLLNVDLRRDEQASFEICSENTPSDAVLRGALTFVVWRPKAGKAELSVPLEDKFLALMKRKGDEACLVLGGGIIENTDSYALDAVWGRGELPARLADLALRARVLAKRPLGRKEGLWVALVALGALGAALAMYAPARAAQPEVPLHRALMVVPAAVLAAAVGFSVLLFLPLSGASGGLGRGVLIGVGEIGLAALSGYFLYAYQSAYAPGERSARVLRGLGLVAPDVRSGPSLLAAPLAAGLLVPLARAAMALVPSTGEAPLETFISWPSGALCFALVGMLVPCAEELFFRGFVYGALRSWSPVLAFVSSVLLFALAHAQQSFGNWGALVAVTCTGVVMTSLRAFSGSTLVSAVAHVLYNASLWRSSFDH